ncbi:ferredoxin reductase [Streptomyces ziwulingensis]|uniref:Ferredoxin reductase n=1 Tax=Streptomyces ziwulingensis TaxID=1045501 RepID=A0ABP9C6Z4_9ACTN
MSGWRPARLVGRRELTPTGRSLTFAVPHWPGHLPGQHVDVRLTADDGYQAVRSYSLAGPAADGAVELGVQTVPGGEVSSYLADDLPVGARVEVSGPLGGWFVWRPQEREPVLLIAGGSGVVPLVAMLRERRATGADTPFALVYSVRDPEQIWYGAELDGDAGVRTRYVFTRRAPADEPRPPGRVTADDLAGLLSPGRTRAYVCGPTGFVEHVAGLLIAAGQPADRIRTERFG